MEEERSVVELVKLVDQVEAVAVTLELVEQEIHLQLPYHKEIQVERQVAHTLVVAVVAAVEVEVEPKDL